MPLPCPQCEAHAPLHSGLITQFGSCAQCEAHAEMHAQEGLGGCFLISLALTCTAILPVAARTATRTLHIRKTN